MKRNQSVRQLAIAIYVVNRHAKTAPDNRQLYALKKKALEKLISEGFAEKIGLHFVDNPKQSKQHSTVLVQCQDFLFHTVPEKEDFLSLPHLGQQDRNTRNPQERMSLNQARELLTNFLGLQPEREQKLKRPIPKRNVRPVNQTKGFRSSYLDGN
ncbi:YkyB family protein [Sporosarcina sp. 179-K 3D1 HS]|uniref:YkyB family protein n=1 Tax=Sporosarcina sp. 179-K 3D1 HS TaxID=3232169 RepID=UPI0039A2F0FF